MNHWDIHWYMDEERLAFGYLGPVWPFPTAYCFLPSLFPLWIDIQLTLAIRLEDIYPEDSAPFWINMQDHKMAWSFYITYSVSHICKQEGSNTRLSNSPLSHASHLSRAPSLSSLSPTTSFASLATLPSTSIWARL